jgi:serine/threonine-protein kinase
LNAADRRRRIEDLCHAALERDPAGRAAFVADACGSDTALRREVEALLVHAQTAEGFLGTPLAAVAANALTNADGTSLLGRSLGAYQIRTRLGSGGMGEVYSARDTKLGRDVALKVLPKAFTSDADRLARFEREARVLATLNHPNIGAIYGVEESNGVRALVLELVKGNTLADRIAAGPVPIRDALTMARQIAEALEAAHEKGIVHRDLKPANVNITPDGIVKVLDFGLAKLVMADGASAGLAQSPTVTLGSTRDGVLLGTAAYMSPEQATGKAADKRSDIWAFGCVLFEMLAGKRAFDGEDVSDTLASVLRGDPDWAAMPPGTPPAILRLLRRCLEKDRHRRFADIAAALALIEEAPDLTTPPSGIDATAVEQQVTAAVAVTRREELAAAMRRRAVLGSAAAFVAGSALVGTAWLAMRPAPPRATRFPITPTGTAALAPSGVGPDVTITPDGTRVIYLGNRGTQLLVRALDQLEPASITTAIGQLRGVFSAPDGQWVGFVENVSTLKKVAITGRPPVTLAAMDGASRGATWLPDETIIFATANTATGLQRLSAAGGAVTVLTRPDGARGEADHVLPERLPDGRAVLFTILPTSGGLEARQVAVLDLASGTQTTLIRGGYNAHYVPSGHLVYAAGGTLWAVAFDVARRAVRGTPVPVVVGADDYAVAGNGTLVYVDAPGGGVARTLVWVDRQGREESLGAPSRAYRQPSVSPDGTRVVVASQDQEQDLWRWDLPRGPLTRLTFEPGADWFPVWTPDGRRLVFSSGRSGRPLNLFWQAADGTGAAERLTESPNRQVPTSITPDGTQVVFTDETPTRGTDLRLLTLGPDRPSSVPQAQGQPDQGREATGAGRSEPGDQRRVTPLLETRFSENNGVLSPDGRWLAYQSNRSGQYEIYVRPFPTVDEGQWQVSATGGTRPLWARSGQELFFIAPDGALMGVPVAARGAVWHAGPPARLLDGRYVVAAGGNAGRDYDVAPDGQRFLMLKEDATAAQPQLVVVQHFDEELKRLVPKK